MTKIIYVVSDGRGGYKHVLNDSDKKSFTKERKAETYRKEKPVRVINGRKSILDQLKNFADED